MTRDDLIRLIQSGRVDVHLMEPPIERPKPGSLLVISIAENWPMTHEELDDLQTIAKDISQQIQEIAGYVIAPKAIQFGYLESFTDIDNKQVDRSTLEQGATCDSKQNTVE